ncbi:Membrane-bound lytic murein transglycosylase F [Pandoraea terrae]|uniref:Membrane-bound lytic murein transglycosylase F n=1 Tax=Pandoraea terrae TaxID=1537710 RepID=A0A5E4ZEM0_9BURK|nr:lytic transglycosylase domain-containing protein [Pandoraea terrae]VVE59318.1 Membrane-bound lytic murein transglycosylase F [Pandoraea terrae]
MSDQLDKFVLTYTVEVSDSIKRLEDLNKKVEQTNKNGDGSTKGFGKFTKAAQELSDALPSGIRRMGEVASNFSKIGMAGGGAVAGVVAVAAAIKIATEQAKEFNKQSDLALKIGTTPLTLENFARNMSASSGGKVGYNQSNDIYSKIAALGSAAYTNPFQNNREAFMLRGMHVDINNPNGGIASVTTQVSQVSKALAAMSEGAAYAAGELLSFSKTEVDALRKLNGATSERTHMSDEEAAAYYRAIAASRELQGAQGLLGEQIRRAEQAIATHFLPTWAKFLTAIADGVGKLNLANAMDDADAGNAAADKEQQQDFKTLKNVWGSDKSIGDKFAATWEVLQHDHWDAYKKAVEDRHTPDGELAKDGAVARAKADAEDSAAQQYAETSYNMVNEFNRNMQLFSQAVNTFSGAIDEKQAWAAWAGEIGKAGGLGGRNTCATDTAGSSVYNAGAYSGAYGGGQSSGNAPSGGRDNHQYDDLISKAAQANGLSPLLLKQVISAESHFDPKIVSPKGAVGLGQIMPPNFKYLGITDPTDPVQNINGSARLLKEAIARNKGDIKAGLMDYNAGPAHMLKNGKLNWENDETIKYPGRVLSQNVRINGQGVAGYPQMDQMDYGTVVSDAWNPKAQPTFSPVGGSSLGDMRKGGESRNSAQRSLVAQMLAGYLHVSPQQLMTGSVNKGDVAWEYGQAETDLLNNRTKLNAQLANPGMMNPKQMSAAQQALRDTTMQLIQLRKWGGGFIDQAQAGDRSQTLGDTRRPVIENQNIQIDIHDAHEPHKVAATIQQHLSSHFADLTHGYADGMNY